MVLVNYYAPPLGYGALSDDARLTSVCVTSDVCLSVAYIGPKSRTERPRKPEIGTEVVHVTRDSNTKGQKVEGQLAGAVSYCGGLPRILFIRVFLYFLQ